MSQEYTHQQPDGASSLALTYEIRAIQKDLARIDSDLKLQNSALYDPDKGIYKRISDINDKLTEMLKMLKALEHKTQNRHTSYEEKLLSLETTETRLVEISGGEHLPFLRLAIEKFKKNDKVIWALSTAAIGGLVKVLYDLLATFF